jgi:hypothetical protein
MPIVAIPARVNDERRTIGKATRKVSSPCVTLSANFGSAILHAQDCGRKPYTTKDTEAFRSQIENVRPIACIGQFSKGGFRLLRHEKDQTETYQKKETQSKLFSSIRVFYSKQVVHADSPSEGTSEWHTD